MSSRTVTGRDIFSGQPIRIAIEDDRIRTVNPGCLLGGRGATRPGAKADLIRFTIDEDEQRMRIQSVLIEGREVL